MTTFLAMDPAYAADFMRQRAEYDARLRDAHAGARAAGYSPPPVAITPNVTVGAPPAPPRSLDPVAVARHELLTARAGALASGDAKLAGRLQRALDALSGPAAAPKAAAPPSAPAPRRREAPSATPRTPAPSPSAARSTTTRPKAATKAPPRAEETPVPKPDPAFRRAVEDGERKFKITPRPGASLEARSKAVLAASLERLDARAKLAAQMGLAAPAAGPIRTGARVAPGSTAGAAHTLSERRAAR